MRALIILGTFLFSSQCACADFIEVRLPHEEQVTIEIDDNYNVKALKDDIEEMFGLPEEFQLVLSKESPLTDEVQLHSVSSKVIWIEMADEPFAINELISKGTYAGYRVYDRPISSKEKKDIAFILKNMGTKSLIQLLKLKSKLKSAGDRIDGIHPITFLSHIFRGEELKAYVHAIKKRGGFLWEEFVSGFRDSLKEEADLGNITDGMIREFSTQVGIDSGIITPSIHNYEWDSLFKLLILHIPRKDDSGDYDM